MPLFCNPGNENSKSDQDYVLARDDNPAIVAVTDEFLQALVHSCDDKIVVEDNAVSAASKELPEALLGQTNVSSKIFVERKLHSNAVTSVHW